MKQIKKLTFLFIISFCVIAKVCASDASAYNWKLYCEDVSIPEGGSTNCYVMAKINNAGTGEHNIKYISTRLTGRNIFIEQQETPNYIAHGMPNLVLGSTTTRVNTLSYNFNNDATFNNGFSHRSNKCLAALGCYDFYKPDNGVILNDTSNAVSRNITANNALTAIGYWKIYIDEEETTPDSSEACARLCLDVDYAIEGQTGYSEGVQSDESNLNGACQEFHLVSIHRCEYTGGKYYNRAGQEVSESAYRQDCLSCKQVGSTYYNHLGVEVTYAEYDADCNEHTLPVCSCNGTTCYNKNSQIVSEAEYRKDCFPACKCENNKCYNKSHQEVTETEYRKDCFSCKKDGNRYYNKDGVETTKEKYEKDCFPACKCENNKCYNKSHQEVTEAEYRKDCFSCKKDGNRYYNKDGKEVTEALYNKDCNPHCRCEDGQCYDDDGTPISDEEYMKKCTPKCVIVDNKYYNDKGKEVSKEEYEKACTCRIDNNKYYNDKGKEVTKEEYYKACNPKCRCEKGQCYNDKGAPVTDKEYKRICGCRKENGKFYDADGKEVSEKEWNAKCVPATGSFIRYIVIIGFIAVFVGLYYYIRIYKAKKKIYKV